MYKKTYIILASVEERNVLAGGKILLLAPATSREPATYPTRGCYCQRENYNTCSPWRQNAGIHCPIYEAPFPAISPSPRREQAESKGSLKRPKWHASIADTASKTISLTSPKWSILVAAPHRYTGLYGGLKQEDIHCRKGLRKTPKVLDQLGSTELAANHPGIGRHDARRIAGGGKHQED